MNIEWIETFLDICETRSFNKTAENLRITQSTVSSRIAALERALNCRLLARCRSGTALTTAGLQFEPHARALRLGWTVARQSVQTSGSAALTFRVGIQHDLVDGGVAPWVAALQEVAPDTALYFEADYSTQMCADVAAGQLDVAVIYSPKMQPDLHFVSMKEVEYMMVSALPCTLSDIRTESYILANYAPAFAATHAALLPTLSMGAVSSGQSAVIRGLLSALGGATYVLAETAADMERAGQVHRVRDAPRITQPVYAVMHMRNRHRALYRRVLQALAKVIP